MTMSSSLPIACCQPLAAPSLTDDEAESTATLFKALGDPARVKIVNLLARTGEPVCACDFEAALGLSQPTVSHHLKKLTDAGLLRARAARQVGLLLDRARRRWTSSRPSQT